MIRIVRMICLVYIHTVICSSSWWSGGVVGGLLFETCLPYAVILGVRRPSTPDASIGGPDVQKLSFLFANSAPLLSP
jgi:hypothetical protein